MEHMLCFHEYLHLATSQQVGKPEFDVSVDARYKYITPLTDY